MCEPATLAMVGAGVAGGGSLVGGVSRSIAIRRAAGMQAAIDQRNAVTADQAAGDALLRGNTASARVKLQTGAEVSKQTAALASSGVNVAAGSSLDVLSSTEMMGELDAQTVRNNAAREAWGYRTQADQFRTRARLAQMTGDSQADAAILGGITGAASYGAQMLKVA